MSKPDTWMPLYIGDYLADTMHLQGAEHGAYLLLLMHYWRNGPLPNDDKMLAGIGKIERRAWDKDIGATVKAFFALEGGRLHQKRMDAERARSQDLSDKRRAAANSRHEKKDGSISGGGANDMQTASNSDAIAPAIAKQLDTHAGTCAIVPPSPSKQERKVPPSADAGASLTDPRAVVWSEGLATLIRITGLPVGKAKPRLGQLLRDANDDAVGLMRVLRDCPQTGDPQAWLTRSAQALARPREPPSKLGWMLSEPEPVTIDAEPEPRSLMQ